MTDLDFRYFSEVARLLNFSRASENLFITQSALSRAIQKMEAELGAKLFSRDRRGVELTAAGEALLKNYSMVEKANIALKKAVKSAEETERGCRIRIGIQNGRLLSENLRGKLESFSLGPTPVSLEIMSLPYNELFRQLEEGSIDVALAYEFPFKDYEGFERKTVEEDEIGILVSESHPVTECRSMDEIKNMLSGMDMLSFGREHQANYLPFLLSGLARAEIRPRGVEYFSSHIDVANSIIMGKGFAVTGRSERLRIGKFIALPEIGRMRFSSFVSSSSPSNAARRFMESL